MIILMDREIHRIIDSPFSCDSIDIEVPRNWFLVKLQANKMSMQPYNCFFMPNLGRERNFYAYKKNA